ncbi:hypothetical protein QUV83_05965 [Cellulomonas cellasea]|uniref:hypothetical protein n=1 Tax=Cellulomonas cellasea TaxID=43670 RepID=UPI0025A4863A|nr:hypothetical protein [Cellulomonas cellasea]MDM8084305.1 hypothetical protein [Cellulomonas cellasea]
MTGELPFDDPGPIAHVREGMKVVDVEGHEVGKVGFVRMGDPEAVTARGQEPGGGGGIIGAVAAAMNDEERLPRQARDELARIGYLRIDRHALGGWHRFASSAQVARVEGDVVHLSAREADLVR